VTARLRGCEAANETLLACVKKSVRWTLNDLDRSGTDELMPVLKCVLVGAEAVGERGAFKDPTWRTPGG
jgi:hypothetical protein